MTAISLNDNWRCTYTAPQADLPDFQSGEPIHSLADWSVDPQQVSKAVWLKRTFELESTDYCVNYMLYVNTAPSGTRLYINDEAVGTLPGEIDITMAVALGENKIVIRVQPSVSSRIGIVELRPVPCD